MYLQIAATRRRRGGRSTTADQGPSLIDPYFQFTGVKNFTQLQADISATTDGQTLDLGGYLYEPDDLTIESVIGPNTGSRTITNGGVTMTKTVSWTSIGSGVWATTDVDPNDYVSVFGTTLVYMIDTRLAPDSQPLVSQYPTSPSPYEKYRMTYSSAWIQPRNESESDLRANVHTTTGDNTGGDITGFTTTDLTLATEIKAFTDGRDGSQLAIIYRAGGNTISSTALASVTDAGGGHVTVTFAGTGHLSFDGYIQLAFFGDAASMVAGEYSFDYVNNRMLYKPETTGNPGDYARLVIKGNYALSMGQNTTIDNIRAFGQVSSGSSAGILRGATGASGVTVSNCRLLRVDNGITTSEPITIEDTWISWAVSRCMAVSDGATVERCVLSNAEGASAIICQGDRNGLTNLLTTIRDNAFYLPRSTHGQGLALYANAWQNALVEHNLFYNNQRPYSFQPSGTPDPTVQGLTFRNNLCVWNATMDVAADGQVGIAWNGSPDLFTTTAGDVLFEHNTFIADDNISLNKGESDSIPRPGVLDINDLVRNRVIIRGNLYYALFARNGTTYPVDGLDPATPDNGGDECYYNLSVANSWKGQGAHGATDLASVGSHPADVSTVFNFTTNQQAGNAATGAIDSGKVGHRWATTPTAAQCQAIFDEYDIGWAVNYPAASMPDYSGFTADADDHVLKDEDKR